MWLLIFVICHSYFKRELLHSHWHTQDWSNKRQGLRKQFGLQTRFWDRSRHKTLGPLSAFPSASLEMSQCPAGLMSYPTVTDRCLRYPRMVELVLDAMSIHWNPLLTNWAIEPAQWAKHIVLTLPELTKWINTPAHLSVNVAFRVTCLSVGFKKIILKWQ